VAMEASRIRPHHCRGINGPCKPLSMIHYLQRRTRCLPAPYEKQPPAVVPSPPPPVHHLPVMALDWPWAMPTFVDLTRDGNDDQ
jgi:hypothetical protein